MNQGSMITFPRLWNLAFVFSTALLAGCVNLDTMTERIPGNTVPFYEQSEAVRLIHPFEFTVKECRWADEYEKPSFANLPKKIQEEQRHNFVVKPSGKFLVVEISLKNLSHTAAGWNRLEPLLFTLRNAQGYEYVDASAKLQVANLTSQMGGGMISVNPQMSQTGTFVFDVPQGSYALVASTSIYSMGNNEKQRSLWGWNLSPSLK